MGLSLTLFTDAPSVLLCPGAAQTPEPKNIVVVSFRLHDGPAGTLVPLFIGDGPARQAILSFGEKGAGMTVLKLADFAAAVKLLAGLQTIGATHVQFNASPDGPAPVPIGEVIEALRHLPGG